MQLASPVPQGSHAAPLCEASPVIISALLVAVTSCTKLLSFNRKAFHEEKAEGSSWGLQVEDTAWFPCCPALIWDVSLAPALQKCFQAKRLLRGKALTEASQEAAIGFVSRQVKAKSPELHPLEHQPVTPCCSAAGRWQAALAQGQYLYLEAGGKQAGTEVQANGTRTSCNLIWCSRSGSVDGSNSTLYVTSDQIFGTLDYMSPPHTWFEVGQKAILSDPSARFRG